MATKAGKVGKQRSRQAAAKRFRLSGSGKVMRTKAGVRHLLLQKSTSQKKHGRKGLEMANGDAKTVSRMLPNLTA